MKNNYNPFTVPENFFEDVQTKATSNYKRCRRKLRNSVVALVALAAIVIVVPIFINENISTKSTENEIAVNTLASMYEYDIFLQVNF